MFLQHRLDIKMDDIFPKVKLKCLDRCLVAGCSKGQKSCLLHVSGWEISQLHFSQMSVSVIFCYVGAVVNFCSKFDFIS